MDTSMEDTQPTGSSQSPFISPVVAHLAREHGIPLDTVQGSGEGGRITKKDILGVIENRKQQPPELVTEPEPEVVHLPPAATAAAAVAAVDMQAVGRHIAANHEAFAEKELSLTPAVYILSAAAQALCETPLLQDVWDENDPYLRLALRQGSPPRAHALPPVTGSSLPALPVWARYAAEALTSGEQATPNSFVVEDHSDSGLLMAFPALPPGQACVLAAGGIRKQPVAVAATMAVHPVLHLTLIYDPGQIDTDAANVFLDNMVKRLEAWE